MALDNATSTPVFAAARPVFQPENIPPELKALPRWVLWCATPADARGKFGKLPFCADDRVRNGKLNGSTDRLVLFDEAASIYAKRVDRPFRFAGIRDAARAKRRGYAGVGFAPQLGDDIVVVDLDGVVSSDGQIAPGAESLVRGTYYEFSPSHTGLRAFFRGTLPGGVGELSLRAIPDFEIDGEIGYASGRFFTVTGDVVDLFNDGTIAAVPGAIVDLWERALNAEGGGSPATGDLRKPPRPIDDLHLDLVIDSPRYGVMTIREAWERGLPAKGQKLRIQSPYRPDSKSEAAVLRRDVDGLPVVYDSGDDDGHVTHRLPKETRHALLAGEFPTMALTDEQEAQSAAVAGFKRNRADGAILAILPNITQALERPAFCGCRLGHDAFLDSTMIERPNVHAWCPLADADLVQLREDFERRGFRPVGREIMRDAVLLVAERNKFDSAQAWLQGIAWDGVPRVETSLTRYFGAEDSPYHRAVALCIWTQMAGRVLDPGCKADMVPIAVGKQGTRKSSTIAAMSPLADAFAEFDLAARDEDAARLLRGKLILELGELRGLRRRDHDSLKAFVTRTHENWVPKFREHATTFARRCVFFGSTNNETFLSDDTGNRRWLGSGWRRRQCAGRMGCLSARHGSIGALDRRSPPQPAPSSALAPAAPGGTSCDGADMRGSR